MITQPVNQVRLTNVAYVRLNKKGKRFEIACYRNKVVNWRNKIETDIDEVLQVASVFTNVSKGNLASSKDLMEAFGTTDTKTICAEILDKGDLQVSEQERQALLDSMFRDVAAIASDLSINPENGRSYSLAMIQEGMKQVHVSVSLTKSAKQQALEVIRKLKGVMTIARAAMHLKIVCRDSDVSAIMSMLEAESKSVSLVTPTASSLAPAGDVHARGSEAQPVSSSSELHQEGAMAAVEVRADPEAYRRLEDAVRNITQGKSAFQA
jgi:ribosome maturation protein SDO1